jgi:DnaJ-class molecular chaperone
MAQIDSDDAERVMRFLDTECWQCGGSGKWRTSDCDVCSGSGYQLTRAGVELMNFLRRHKGQMKRD